MIQRNKGHTQKFEMSFRFESSQVSKFKDAIIRILDRVKVQESDQVQLNDVKEIYKLLEYFSEPIEKK